MNKWYIVDVGANDLHVKQTFNSKEEARDKVAEDIGDKRKFKHIGKVEDLFYYQYNLKLFWLVDEETALRDGFGWMVKKVKPEKKKNELELVRYGNSKSSNAAS